LAFLQIILMRDFYSAFIMTDISSQAAYILKKFSSFISPLFLAR